MTVSVAKRISGVLVIFFPLAPGPHPRRALSLMPRLGFTVLGSAWPQALLLLAEQPRDLGRPLGVQLDDVARAHALEQALDVFVAQANAPVRLREADRPRLIGAVDAVALLAQADP